MAICAPASTTIFTRGTDQYPQSLTSAYNTVNEHRRESVTDKKKKKEEVDEVTPGGLSFLQRHELVLETDGKTHKDIQCYGCKLFGHFKHKSPKATTK